MNEREQIRQVCRWNQDLARENRALRLAFRESQEVVAKAGVERDSALVLFDTAMDEAVKARRP
jgi:hypothetical protein